MSARYRVVWTQVAVRDLESIIDYVVAEDGVGPARRLYEKLDEAIASLDTLPSRCRIVPELRAEGLPMYRELVVRPYRIMFRIRGREVVFLGVFDGRRDLEELLVERSLAQD